MRLPIHTRAAHQTMKWKLLVASIIQFVFILIISEQRVVQDNDFLWVAIMVVCYIHIYGMMFQFRMYNPPIEETIL